MAYFKTWHNTKHISVYNNTKKGVLSKYAVCTLHLSSDGQVCQVCHHSWTPCPCTRTRL